MPKTVLLRGYHSVGRKPKPKPDPAFARRLRALRTKANLTQAELARLADVQHMTISNLERAAGAPAVETVFALATALGVPAEELFALLRPKPKKG
jgi:transcriptional regulator with XRE-family HTH domain